MTKKTAKQIAEQIKQKTYVEGLLRRCQTRNKNIDPYAVDFSLPVVVSFSGGRTSAYLLRQLLDRYNDKIPDNVFVVFRNTGKERLETLDFIKEIEIRWHVPIRWLEYRYLGWDLGKSEKHSFVEVNYETASRNGEPFDQVIEARQDCRRDKEVDLIVPNQGMRWCTGELKQNTLLRWLKSKGIKKFHNWIGIRYDEPKRWANIDCPSKRMTGETPLVPLVKAGVTVTEVNNYWRNSPFDLKLEQHEGNCDLCFLKARWKLQTIMEKFPEKAEWWKDHERKSGCQFRLNESYQEIQNNIVKKSLPVIGDIDEIECACTD